MRECSTGCRMRWRAEQSHSQSESESLSESQSSHVFSLHFVSGDAPFDVGGVLGNCHTACKSFEKCQYLRWLRARLLLLRLPLSPPITSGSIGSAGRTNPNQDEVHPTGSWPSHGVTQLRYATSPFFARLPGWFIKVFDGAEK